MPLGALQQYEENFGLIGERPPRSRSDQNAPTSNIDSFLSLNQALAFRHTLITHTRLFILHENTPERVREHTALTALLYFGAP